LYTAPWMGAMDGGHKVNASFPDKLSTVTEYIVWLRAMTRRRDDRRNK